ETNTFSEYKEIKLDQLKLYPLTIDKEINNYKLSKITINDIEFDALIQNNSDYAIIHAQNMNNGTSDYYTYDKKTNTVITYTNETLKPLEDKIDKYEKMILLLTGETILVFFILLCILISKIRHTKKRKRLHQMMMQQKELEERQKEIKEKEEKELNKSNEVKEETKSKKKKKDKKKKN
ncbi:MAG: hypothetical protein SPI44_03645, partial [Bacilli bacterium]|nr:hypothetical protein [Bacilli bacterium]